MSKFVTILLKWSKNDGDALTRNKWFKGCLMLVPNWLLFVLPNQDTSGVVAASTRNSRYVWRGLFSRRVRHSNLKNDLTLGCTNRTPGPKPMVRRGQINIQKRLFCYNSSSDSLWNHVSDLGNRFLRANTISVHRMSEVLFFFKAQTPKNFTDKLHETIYK